MADDDSTGTGDEIQRLASGLMTQAEVRALWGLGDIDG